MAGGRTIPRWRSSGPGRPRSASLPTTSCSSATCCATLRSPGPAPFGALATAPLEVADLVGPHQPAHAIEDAYRRDGAVVDLDVPVDLGSRAKRPGDRGPDHDIVGVHHGGTGGR